MKKPVLLSGMQPTSGLHLGNYLGALKNWVKLQDQYDCVFLAVDLHSITVKQDPKELRENTYQVMAAYIAGGVDPEKVTLAVQSHLPQHAELAWILTCMSTMGELNRMTQFKDKSSKQGKHIPTGLFIYPTLMAADILVYQANLVPVGQDQKQHLELARDLAERVNNRFGKKLFTIPEPYIAPVGAKIMDLQDPTAKMSKSSDNENATLFLTDSDSALEKKLKRAVTDSENEIQFDFEKKPGVSNLLSIQSAITGKSIESIVKSYAGKQYGHLKVETAEIVIEALRPLREEMEKLLKDKGYLDQILKKGAQAAGALAQKTVDAVYDALGFIPRT